MREDGHVLKIDKEHPSSDLLHHVSTQEEHDGADGQTAETDVGGRRDLETLLLQKVHCPVNVLLTGNQRHDQLRVLVYDPVPAWTDPPA